LTGLSVGNCNIGDVGIARVVHSATGLRVVICGSEHQTEQQAAESTLTDDAVMNLVNSRWAA
jgi:hypothetical protein